MRVTTITSSRTYNTGNYHSQRFEMTADLESGDQAQTCIQLLADSLHTAAMLAMHPEQRIPPIEQEDPEWKDL